MPKRRYTSPTIAPRNPPRADYWRVTPRLQQLTVTLQTRRGLALWGTAVFSLEPNRLYLRPEVRP